MKKNRKDFMDIFGYVIFCIMPLLNWIIAGWTIGKYMEIAHGWPYPVGVLFWAGVNIVATIFGMVLITRQS